MKMDNTRTGFALSNPLDMATPLARQDGAKEAEAFRQA
jgi:hypothetical protein